MKITIEIEPDEIYAWNTLDPDMLRRVPSLIRHILSGFGNEPMIIASSQVIKDMGQ